MLLACLVTLTCAVTALAQPVKLSKWPTLTMTIGDSYHLVPRNFDFSDPLVKRAGADVFRNAFLQSGASVMGFDTMKQKVLQVIVKDDPSLDRLKDFNNITDEEIKDVGAEKMAAGLKGKGGKLLATNVYKYNGAKFMVLDVDVAVPKSTNVPTQMYITVKNGRMLLLSLSRNGAKNILPEDRNELQTIVNSVKF